MLNAISVWKLALSSEYYVCLGLATALKDITSQYTFIIGGLVLCFSAQCASIVLYRFKGRRNVPSDLSPTSHLTFNFNFLLLIYKRKYSTRPPKYLLKV